MWSMRGKRDGETRAEYETALLVFVQQCLSSEFPGNLPTLTPTSSDAPKTPSAGLSHPVRKSSASQTQLARYKKTAGAADGVGESYERKMLTLVFLRMLHTGYVFKLASNMEAAGLFDDIVLRYRKHSDGRSQVAYLQLKHKQKKSISKSAFLGLSGDFSLIKYCASYELLVTDKMSGSVCDHHQFIIFTNANVHESLVFEMGVDTLLDTGGKAVSFKAGGEIFTGLCEWVDFKEALTELHGQVEGLTDEEVATRIKEVLQTVKYQNISMAICKDDLLKTPTFLKLGDLLRKLELVKDKNTYSSFLANLQVYTNQAHESKLDSKITIEVSKVWKQSINTDTSIMLHDLQDRVKSWWQRDNFYLTQDSSLWLSVIKSQTETMSKNTIDELVRNGVEFALSSLEDLYEKINKNQSAGGILNLRVDSRTAASSLRVHQALAKFCPNEIVLHVNVKALLEREDDVFSAWNSRWCRLLVVECNDHLNQSHAERINEKIMKVLGREKVNKLLILIAAEKHALNVLLYHAECFTRFNDNFVWSDLTEQAMEKILSKRIKINEKDSLLTLSDLVGDDKRYVNKFDLEVISQILTEDISCGKRLDEVGFCFVHRRLKMSADGVPFVVNSLSGFKEKVVLVVAEPGMGKSTLITHLANSAKNEDPSAWIVHIKLNDCAHLLDGINVNHFNESSLKIFLEQSALGSGNNLEKLIFGALGNKLVVFVDGVDEVCPHYEQKVFKLLSYLKDMKISKLWVASRPVFQSKLETTLKTKSLHLVAFSEEDRNVFFNNFWKVKEPSASSEKCSEATRSLLTLLNDSLGKDNPILGVPLMTAMIAEIFQERLFSAEKQWSGFQNAFRFNLMQLYSTFVHKKFDLYCVEKKKSLYRELAAAKDDEEHLLRQMHHHHRLAALVVLFSRDEIAGLQFDGKEKFDHDLATYLKEVADGREKIGIIDNVIDGTPHFVHRSFAEYFAASWLARNFKDNRKFVKRIIFDPAFKLLGEMFHRSLAENHTLHVAVLNRDLEETERILNCSPVHTDVNEADAGGRTPFLLAVLLSSTDQHPDCVRIMKNLIKRHNARPDVVDEVLGWSALQYAEWSRAWNAVHVLLENGRNVRQNRVSFIQKLTGKQAIDSSLMLDAARNASVLVVRYLLEKRGGKLDYRGTQGETMIHIAAARGNVEMLKYLVHVGLSLDFRDVDNNTALHYATRVDHVPTVCYLLDQGVDMNASNSRGLTALYEAARHEGYQVIPVLLEKGATYKVGNQNIYQLDASLLCGAFTGDLEHVQQLGEANRFLYLCRDVKGHTAAWVAMRNGQFEVMNWLLRQGSKDGDTPLHRACLDGEYEIVSYLISQPDVDIEVKGWRGMSPLHSASLAGLVDVMQLLLDKGANVDCRDNFGNTPLHEASASWRRDKQAVDLLLRHGADVNSIGQEGRTPLHAASWLGIADVMELLLANGADVECRDDFGFTPMHKATRRGSKPAVELLLRHGANVKVKNYKGETPLDFAINRNRLGVVELLLDNENHPMKR